MSTRRGILISNLGSPDAPTPEAVKPYLDQFLMDPYVIDLPFVLRAVVVRGIILRSRPAKSAEAYKVIWTEDGSPLVHSTRKLTEKVQNLLGDAYSVKFAMRYGNPSFESVLNSFVAEGITEVDLLPLYPQWALASTGSTLAHLKELDHACKIHSVLAPFYKDENFISLIEQRARVATSEPALYKTHYLFSFHGIPERHIKKTPGCKNCPIDDQCCLSPEAPALCYRSHCTQTAHAVAKKLGLKREDFTIAFQSRLGVDQWLLPFTDVVLKELPQKGIERLIMLSPAFTADCLETIEELGERGREDFIAAGGREYILVPSLNADEDWAKLLVNWIRDRVGFTNAADLSPVG